MKLEGKKWEFCTVHGSVKTNQIHASQIYTQIENNLRIGIHNSKNFIMHPSGGEMHSNMYY